MDYYGKVSSALGQIALLAIQIQAAVTLKRATYVSQIWGHLQPQMVALDQTYVLSSSRDLDTDAWRDFKQSSGDDRHL